MKSENFHNIWTIKESINDRVKYLDIRRRWIFWHMIKIPPWNMIIQGFSSLFPIRKKEGIYNLVYVLNESLALTQLRGFPPTRAHFGFTAMKKI